MPSADERRGRAPPISTIAIPPTRDARETVPAAPVSENAPRTAAAMAKRYEDPRAIA